MSGSDAPEQSVAGHSAVRQHEFYRFHLPHSHLASVFGDDWFALKAEAFARFFGTPTFLVAQTAIVGVWILINIAGWWVFDQYPFILLNLAFSLQAAYAAPLILLAQTRQADRDKVTTMADAQHREEIARTSEERQRAMAEQTAVARSRIMRRGGRRLTGGHMARDYASVRVRVVSGRASSWPMR